MSDDAFKILKSSVKLSEYVGRFTSKAPKPQGSKGKFMSNCPIHGSEKATVFSIDDNIGLWKCFSECGGGSLIDFYMKMNNLTANDMKDVVSGLSADLGVTLPESERNTRQGTSRAKILKALNSAADYANDKLLDIIDKAVEYEAVERSGKKHKTSVNEDEASVFKYVHERSLVIEDDEGIDAEIIEEYRLGFFPTSDGLLVDELIDYCGGDREALVAAGVLRKDERGKVYCQLRGRMIIPILNERGDVIGLSGRIIPGVKSGNPEAKYINPTETPLYSKSNALYGIEYLNRRDSKSASKTKTVIVTEGYFDSIAINEVFIDDDEIMGVAVCGTAFTSGHVELVNTAEKVILLFDSDAAGQKAMAKNLWMLNHLGDRVYATTLNAKDPWDTFISNPGLLKKMVENASPLSSVIAGAAFASSENADKFDKWVSGALSILDQSSYRDKLLSQAAKLRDQNQSAYSRRISMANVKKTNSRSDDDGIKMIAGLDANMKSLIRRIFQMTDAEKDSVLGSLVDASDEELDRIRRWLPVYSDIDFESFVVAALGNSTSQDLNVDINRTLAMLIPGEDEPVEDIYIVLRNMIMNLSQNATSNPDSEYDIDILASQIVSLRGIDATIKDVDNQNAVLSYLLDMAVAI